MTPGAQFETHYWQHLTQIPSLWMMSLMTGENGQIHRDWPPDHFPVAVGPDPDQAGVGQGLGQDPG